MSYSSIKIRYINNGTTDLMTNINLEFIDNQNYFKFKLIVHCVDIKKY